MPAAIGTLVGSIGGPTGGVGPDVITPEVQIYFTSCPDSPSTSSSTNFEPDNPGSLLTVYAHFEWTYDDPPPMMGADPTKIRVQNFTSGDIQAVAENDEEVEERIERGHVNRASALAGELTSSIPEADTNNPATRLARYYMPITMPANSAGRVYVTVQANSAGTIPEIMTDSSPVYGPSNPVTAVFSYSTLSGAEPAENKPQAYVIVPIQPIFKGTTADIVILWDREMRKRPNAEVTIASTGDADIIIENGTYVDDSFIHRDMGNLANLKRMAFRVTLTGSGTCSINVKADKFTSVEGDTGPAADTIERFLYDVALVDSVSGITPSSAVVIYDSQDQDFSESSHPIIGDQGGAFKGVSDLELVTEGSNSYFYGTIQLQKARFGTGGTPTNELVQERPANAALFRIQNKTRFAGNNSDVDVLKYYRPEYVGPGNTGRITSNTSIIDSARSLTVIGNRVYFFEGSHPRPGAGNVKSVAISEDAINRDRDLGVPWRSRLVNPNAETQEQNITYSQHRNLSSPMITINDDLYLNPGYGNQLNSIRLIKSTDWESSENPEGLDAEETRIDNWTLLKFGEQLDFRPAVIQSNGRTGYEIIRELARMCFSYIGFDGDTFIVRPKYQPLAQLVNSVTESATFNPMTPTDAIEYNRATAQIPSSGYFQVQDHGESTKEIFTYEGTGMAASGNPQLNGIRRAQEGTAMKLHCPDSYIEFFNHIIDANDSNHVVKPINLLSVRQDLRQLYNIIKIGYGDQYFDNEEIARDATSVSQNRPRELEFTVELDHHDSEWVSWLAKQYVRFYGKVRYLIDLQLQPSFYIKVGDFIMLRENQSSLIDRQIFQVLKVNHEIKPYITNVQLRSVTPPTAF